MSRIVKRVPFDFAWPLKKTWGGFVNPYTSSAPSALTARTATTARRGARTPVRRSFTTNGTDTRRSIQWRTAPSSLDELCAYAETHCSTFGTRNFISKEQWREMLDDGFVYHQEGGNIFI
jgi:hypothetical protein